MLTLALSAQSASADKSLAATKDWCYSQRTGVTAYMWWGHPFHTFRQFSKTVTILWDIIKTLITRCRSYTVPAFLRFNNTTLNSTITTATACVLIWMCMYFVYFVCRWVVASDTKVSFGSKVSRAVILLVCSTCMSIDNCFETISKSCPAVKIVWRVVNQSECTSSRHTTWINIHTCLSNLIFTHICKCPQILLNAAYNNRIKDVRIQISKGGRVNCRLTQSTDHKVSQSLRWTGGLKETKHVNCRLTQSRYHKVSQLLRQPVGLEETKRVSAYLTSILLYVCPWFRIHFPGIIWHKDDSCRVFNCTSQITYFSESVLSIHWSCTRSVES